MTAPHRSHTWPGACASLSSGLRYSTSRSSRSRSSISLSRASSSPYSGIVVIVPFFGSATVGRSLPPLRDVHLLIAVRGDRSRPGTLRPGPSPGASLPHGSGRAGPLAFPGLGWWPPSGHRRRCGSGGLAPEEPVAPDDPDHMDRARRLLHAVADRARWQSALNEAKRRAAVRDGPDLSATGRAA
jgi:hypothetical protein